ncbi:MAG: hypothetical protein Q4G69_00915 [Planctomycetia bacterium]|nr:hypothetical protein [Planctomycetia bacterium]
MPFLEKTDSIYSIVCRIKNDADLPISIDLSFRSIESISLIVKGKPAKDLVKRRIVLSPSAEYKEIVSFRLEKGAFPNAHYPLYALAQFEFKEKQYQLQAIRVLETRLSDQGSSNHPVKKSSGVPSSDIHGILISKNDKRDQRFYFPLSRGRKVLVESGENGLLDAKITLADTAAGLRVSFSGVRIGSGDLDLESAQLRFAYPPKISWNRNKKILTCQYFPLINAKEIEITLIARIENDLFIIEAPEESNPKTIGKLEIKPFDSPLKRLFYGHGYVVENPKARLFLAGGGHYLSARHVGLEFENGFSLLMGSSFPPEYFKVDPDQGLYSFEVPDAGKIAFLFGSKGVYPLCTEFRKKCTWISPPGPGTVEKRGRFVFDVWYGRLKDILPRLKKAFEYGATDSLFLFHHWQRWGYDLRLPDIWGEDTVKIDPKVGTLSDLNDLCDLCVQYGVPFGLHDNYSDLYPDADEFSYDLVSFDSKGNPLPAWCNPGIAQSYRWRPDLVRPFLDRNIQKGIQNVPGMNASFVDVLACGNIRSFYSKKGEFFPKRVNLVCWKDFFETISKGYAQKDPQDPRKLRMGITVSEAGDDFLIGSLSGADVQWIDLNQKTVPGTAWFPCKRWARTPWFAAVNHTNFSRHGAGYLCFFPNVRSWDAHGLLSDDYLSIMVLGGLDPMVDAAWIDSAAIPIYYLLHPISRRLADKEIEEVKFDRINENEEELRRQTIYWSDGTVVYVNRSDQDWRVDNQFILPKYGFLVRSRRKDLISGIFRDPQHPESVVEVAQEKDSIYMNGRNYSNARRFYNPPEKRFRPEDDPQAVSRAQGNKIPFTWKGITTGGALVITPEKNSLKILPLPAMKPFEILLDSNILNQKVDRIEQNGKIQKISENNGVVRFEASTEKILPYIVYFKTAEEHKLP